jgi:hypothetical protein
MTDLIVVPQGAKCQVRLARSSDWAAQNGMFCSAFSLRAASSNRWTTDRSSLTPYCLPGLLGWIVGRSENGPRHQRVRHSCCEIPIAPVAASRSFIRFDIYLMSSPPRGNVHMATDNAH